MASTSAAGTSLTSVSGSSAAAARLTCSRSAACRAWCAPCAASRPRPSGARPLPSPPCRTHQPRPRVCPFVVCALPPQVAPLHSPQSCADPRLASKRFSARVTRRPRFPARVTPGQTCFTIVHTYLHGNFMPMRAYRYRARRGAMHRAWCGTARAARSPAIEARTPSQGESPGAMLSESLSTRG